jgi:hypothetical protein
MMMMMMLLLLLLLLMRMMLFIVTTTTLITLPFFARPQLLQLYKDIVDSSVTWQVNTCCCCCCCWLSRPHSPLPQTFDLEQQALVIKAPRSNTELDAGKLLQEYPHIPHAAAAIAGRGKDGGGVGMRGAVLGWWCVAAA